MPGKPGSGGPVPKRSDQRRRVNKPEVPIATGGSGVAAAVPPADESWHPLARDWYTSLNVSGQSEFYQASDWAQARVWAEALSATLSSGKGPSAMMMTAWQSGAAELLTTEGARRRMRIELERAKPVDAGADHADATVTDISARLGA